MLVCKDQLKETEFVKFEHQNENGKRIMFVGNSITLHGVRPEIGWTGAWGMAASSKDLDYIHILEQKVLSSHPQSAFCICQAAKWDSLPL